MYDLLSHGLKELVSFQKKHRRPKRVRVSRRFRQRIFWRDGGKCVYCDAALAFKEATMDHVTPLAHQGRHRSKENIVLSCRNCNKSKDQLILDNLGDLAPDMLWLKFDQTCKA